ncbi:GntR family transcriptional regulator [Mycolicibacterium komossense]|uniref:GntR family transcriptional regulator n=1 Tax=Mycolicibacterium komossense TaxID=1779 RepID=A0ABT3C8F7_9MYCO|nr:GntR family transcriptional regulator [Mycolicibacterium komossense]MCV7225739.1 GntR family transcriptional regulator [Mycolicibacterium komossense]
MNAPVEVRPGRRGLRRAQLSDEVAGYLRAAIMSGSLRPGTFIRLDETAAQLGVSITPVREALLTLRSEGMVRLEPNRGHVVLPLSRRDIEDIFWLQSAIAKELAAGATETISTDAIDELDELTDALETAVATTDSDAVAAAEFAFHRAFNRATGRIKLAWFLLHVARYIPQLIYAADPDWGAAAVRNHRQLVAALRSRDKAAVVELTAWQFNDGAKRLTAMLDKSGIWT